MNYHIHDPKSKFITSFDLRFNRDFETNVYDKRRSSDASFAINKIIVREMFSYTIHSEDQKRHTKALYLTIETWWLVLNDFSHSVTFDLCLLTFAHYYNYKWTA